MTTIATTELATITGGNAMGNGQTGSRYRPNPNDPGTDTSTDPRKGSQPFGWPQGAVAGGLGNQLGGRIGGPLNTSPSPLNPNPSTRLW